MMEIQIFRWGKIYIIQTQNCHLRNRSLAIRQLFGTLFWDLSNLTNIEHRVREEMVKIIAKFSPCWANRKEVTTSE